MEKHLLHLYTGNGKGKTTAAMGQALRMLGHHRPVLITQFMKDGTSGELEALKAFEQAIVFEGARMKGFFRNLTEEKQEETRRQHREALEQMILVIQEKKPALTVLDELSVALAMRLVSPEDAWRLIDAALKFGDTVVTGRYASEQLIEKADYVSRIEAVKHPFDEGQPAREGIEF